jgi:hypothetical protein
MLQPTKFQVVFPRISAVTYFCQSVNIPNLSVTPARQHTPLVDLYRPGEKMEYGTFDIEFIVDEELWSWEIIHDWMRGYSFPCSFDEYKNMSRLTIQSLYSNRPQYSDGYLNTLTGINTQRTLLKFIDAFPVNLSEIKFSTTQSADTIITATASFRYQLFQFERKNIL